MSAVLRPAAAPLPRPMTPRDLDAVVGIEQRAYPFPWSRGNFIDSLAAGYLAELLEAPDGDVVGYFVAMPGVDEMHLLNLTVAPECQRRGHARALLDRLDAHCRVRGLPTVWLEVRESNVRARAVYRRRGFAEIGLRRGYYPAGLGRREHAVLMSRRVPPPSSDAVD